MCLGRPSRRTLALAVIGTALVFGANFITTASAATNPGGTGEELPRSDSASLTGGAGLAPSIRNERAKTTIDVPAVTAAVYVSPKYRELSSAPRVPLDYLPRHPDPACDYYSDGIRGDLYVVDIDQPDPDQAGTIRSVGAFPDVKVSTLAFGALPLSATLHVAQLRRDGRTLPIQATQLNSGKSVAKGDDPSGPTGCDPTWEADVSRTTTATGEVTVSLGNVLLDGLPLDVGPHCRTAVPLQLHLISRDTEGAEYDIYYGGTLVQARDDRTVNPTNPIAVAPGSRNLTIPPFVGCVSAAGQDLSRLVSNAVSGSNATLVVNQASIQITFFDPISNPTMAGVTIPPHLNPPPPIK